MEGLYLFPSPCPPGNVRLIRHNNQPEPGLLQQFNRHWNSRENFKLIRAGRRIRLSVPYDGTIDHPVPVEEYRTMGHFTDSHFVCATFSAGCETNRWPMTDWNASVCGVTFPGLTEGTMTHASATWAV